MFRMLDAMSPDERIKVAVFMPFYNNIKCLYRMRVIAKTYDIVHVHFGGLYALLIWFALIGLKPKKFITFHGTDIHAKAIKSAKSIKEKIKIKLNQKASFLSIILYDKCGFVAQEMMSYVPKTLKKHLVRKAFVHSLGVDYDKFKPIEKKEAHARLNIPEQKYALFSDVSNTSIKRRDIATNIIKELGGEYKLLIMCGVRPDEVPIYINACDFLLLTSDEEGSPNIIRECLALNKPVFSVEVGDAARQLDGLTNSCIISRNPEEAATQIIRTISKRYTDNTREHLKYRLDFKELNKSIVDLYNEINYEH